MKLIAKTLIILVIAALVPVTALAPRPQSMYWDYMSPDGGWKFPAIETEAGPMYLYGE